MPEFTTVSLQEAHMRTLAGRGGRYMSEYADYIQQVPHGQAGRLREGSVRTHSPSGAGWLLLRSGLGYTSQSSGPGRTCISGRRIGKNNREPSAGIPDEQGQLRKQQRRSSPSASLRMGSTACQRTHPRNSNKPQGNQARRDIFS
jgi:hypothetical protein